MCHGAEVTIANTLSPMRNSQSAHHSKPARPHHAASLLVYRYQQHQLEVLLGKRHARARFAPDVYVFPGGAVDRCDYPRVASQVADAPYMGVGRDARLAQALKNAALRETAEETGLVWRGQGAESHAKPPALHYLGRAITPASSPIRFHARFFAAPATQFDGILGGDMELTDLHWVSLPKAMHYPLIDVTAFMLGELPKALEAPQLQPALLTYYAGTLRVRYPNPNK